MAVALALALNGCALGCRGSDFLTVVKNPMQGTFHWLREAMIARVLRRVFNI